MVSRAAKLAVAVLIGLSIMGSYSKCDISTPKTGSVGQDKTPAPHHDPKKPNHTSSPKKGSLSFRLKGVSVPQRSVYWTFRCGAVEDDQLEIRVDRWKIDCQADPGDIIRLKIVSPRAGFTYCAIVYVDSKTGREYVRDQNSLMRPGQCVVAWQVSPSEGLNHKGLIPLPNPS